MRMGVLQRPASYVRVNFGHSVGEGQESEINEVIMPTMRRKYIIIVCQIDTCGPCEDQKRSVEVKVYGSRHPISKRTGDIGVAKIRKGTKTNRVHQSWGAGRWSRGQALGSWRY